MLRQPILLFTRSKKIKLLPFLCVTFIIGLITILSPLNIAIPFTCINLFLLMVFFVKKRRRKILCFSLSDYHIQYHRHNKGWCIRWEDITYIDLVSISKDNWHQTLPWVGIKLKQYDSYLDSIHHNLAVKILNEQQSLLILGYRFKEVDISFENILFDDNPFISCTGKKYTGILAILGNRMKYMNMLLGFDVFIEEEYCTKSKENFVGLLRQHLSSAALYRELSEKNSAP